MPYQVSLFETPEPALSEARSFLLSKPVSHNLILTLLHERSLFPQPGRYWVVSDGNSVVGVALQSPLDFIANITPMPPEAVEALVKKISALGPVLPGVNGEVATAAAFAGQWTEHLKAGASPVLGQRIYETTEVVAPHNVPGRLRKAEYADRDVLIDWLRGFFRDIGDHGSDPERVVDQRLPENQFWLWEDGETVSMAAHSKPIEGVIRIQIVYTPGDKRNRGYAGACTGALSRQICASGHRCILYTDLANPVSNAVFRSIGYRSVSEGMRYTFLYKDRK